MTLPLHRSAPFSDDRIFHGFFTREGGVSEGLFASLNCGPGSGDDPEKVRENRARVARAAGVSPDKLLSLYQVHGNECLVVDRPFGEERPKADALATKTPGLALGILTADCAPVLLRGETEDGAPVVGAAHAGWGGAFRGVLESTVFRMEALGARRESLCAVIGPCIDVSSYEVTEAFPDPFLEQDHTNAHFFRPGRREGHCQFDLAGYCAKKLASAGVRKVFMTDMDTCSRKDEFFSYRRTTHEGGQDYGRQISVIAIV